MSIVGRFTLLGLSENDHQKLSWSSAMEKFSITEVFSSYLGNHPSASAVVKIEIEGSEEGLFLGVSDPQNRTAFLAVEIHDSVGAQNSSRALLDSSHYMTLQ